MESHVIVFGELAFPPGGVRRWQKLAVDPQGYDDWKGDFGGGEHRAEVGAMLARFASYPALTKNLGRLDVEASEARVIWRGYLEDDAFRGLATEVAATFRSAAEAEGRGELAFVQPAGDYAYLVRVEPGTSSFTALRGAKKVQALADKPLCEEASQIYADSFALQPARAAAAAPAPVAAAAAALGGDPWPFVVAKLEAHEPAALYAALLARGGHFSVSLTEIEPVERAFRDTQALGAALHAGAPPAVKVLGLELLQRIDPAAARALAVRVLSADAPNDLLAAAALVLRQAGDEAAQAALARGLARPPLDRRTPFRSLLLAGLAKEPAALSVSVVVRALELLPELAARPDAGDAIAAILELALSRQVPVPPGPATELVARGHAPPRVRELAASALLALGTSEALGALARRVAEPGPLGRMAVRAAFRLDPRGAFDALAPALGQAASQAVVRAHVLAELADRVAAAPGKAPELRDPRWVELALGALAEPGAATFLGYTKDARVPGALAALLPKRFEDVCQALKRLGDPAVLPALVAAAAKVPNPHTAKLVAATIKHLENKAAKGASEPKKKPKSR